MAAIVRNRTARPRTQQQETGKATRADLASSQGNLSGLPMLRTSERGTFKRCRWKWWQEFHELVKPAVDVPPLRFGGLVHEALGAYYKKGIRRGPHPALSFEQAYERDLTDASGQTKNYSKPEIDDKWAEHRDLGIDMLNAYIDRYGKDDEWKVLVTEYAFKTIVAHPTTRAPWFWYTGILDGVWESRVTKRKVIPDHKTTKAINLTYLRMDPQATGYWTFGFDALVNARIVGPNEKIDGMLFNYLRKAKKDTRPQNADGYYLNKPTKNNPEGEVSKQQPSPLHARVPVFRDWYEREGAKLDVLEEFKDMEDVRRGRRAHYKNAGQFTCPGCWALDICELHEIGQDWMELRSLTTKTWDPYAAHEIKEGR